MAENTNIEDLRAPLLAALGAADLALATVNDLIAGLRERAEETRAETRTRVEERRARLDQAAGGPARAVHRAARQVHHRRAAQGRRGVPGGSDRAGTTSWSSAARRPCSGCATRRRFEDASARAEGYVDQAVELTQEALGTVASQTRAVGERAAKLVGIELPGKTEATAKKAPRRPSPRRLRPRRLRPRRLRPRRLRPRRSPRSKHVIARRSAPSRLRAARSRRFGRCPHTLKA